MKAKLSIIMTLVLVLSFSVMAFAVTNIEKVEAFLAHDMTFKVDGEMWQPVDTDGSKLTPIIYNGRSYVPARALLEEKDVMVGFDDDTRTILLDYPKDLDKSTPMLINKGKVDGDIVNIEFKANQNFELKEVSMINETTIELSDKAMIMLDGKEVNIAELAKSGRVIDLKAGTANVEYNMKDKMASSINLESTDDDPAALRIGIEIDISGPPWRIKIRIRF